MDQQGEHGEEQLNDCKAKHLKLNPVHERHFIRRVVRGHHVGVLELPGCQPLLTDVRLFHTVS